MTIESNYAINKPFTAFIKEFLIFEKFGRSLLNFIHLCNSRKTTNFRQKFELELLSSFRHLIYSNVHKSREIRGRVREER